MARLLTIVFLFSFILPQASRGQEPVDNLSRDVIEEFLDETTELTQIDNGMSDTDVQSYLNDHLDDSGVYKSAITYNVPGFPMQTKNMALDKAQFTKNVIAGRSMIENYTSDVTLKRHRIARDKQTAKIETLTEESGKMPLQEGSDHIPFSGMSRCTQNLKLSEKGLVEIVSTDCETFFEFLPE